MMDERQREYQVGPPTFQQRESLEPSPVLAAMGVDAERSVRVSVGWSTTDDDVAAFCDALPRVVERLRALRA